ncbi:hypothetical protein Ahy_B02g057932 [Arachis hypogaea]|uniref:Uncharacterized protein n=1 Tax=Arachis hypogaea TaxID=3818 RepID=A0A445ADH0_ARAHY|nr:hypothetical protein Ahy_B02g057932 [Arachis hypogaea]
MACCVGNGTELEHRIIEITSEKFDPLQCPASRPFIYKVPKSLFTVKREAYTPLLISIGPLHHDRKQFKDMQELKTRYFVSFRDHLVFLEKDHLLEEYKAFLKSEEKNIRSCYQKSQLPDSFNNNDRFVEMMWLDSVFIMELFLREEDDYHCKCKSHINKEDYYITTRPCLSKSIQKDLLLLENQIPMYVLERLYKTIAVDFKKHATFLDLAKKYFRSWDPCSELTENSKNLDRHQILHFTDLIRRAYVPNPKDLKYLEDDNNQNPNNNNNNKKKKKKDLHQDCCFIRTASKLNQAGVSFEKVRHRSLLDIRFETRPFYGYLLCFGCCPFPWSKFFKARIQFPELRIDHRTECVLRNLIVFEQCHYPEEPYICNYVSLVDSLIHTKDDAELLVEKEAIVHELGSDNEVATLVNSLCMHVVTNKTCYHKLMGELNEHYNSNWKWTMGTLRRVYFRDLWRCSSTFVGIAVFIFAIFNFYRVLRGFPFYIPQLPPSSSPSRKPSSVESSTVAAVNGSQRRRNASQRSSRVAPRSRPSAAAPFHKDVKSNNILLDHEFRPHDADFGLNKILQREAGEGGAGAGAGDMSKVAGSYGYIASVYIGVIDSRESIIDITIQGEVMTTMNHDKYLAA